MLPLGRQGVNVTAEPSAAGLSGSKVDEEGILSPSADAACAEPVFEWAGRRWMCRPSVPSFVLARMARACTARRPSETRVSALTFRLLAHAVVDVDEFAAVVVERPDLLDDLLYRVMPALIDQVPDVAGHGGRCPA